jgi:hypothetical protein
MLALKHNREPLKSAQRDAGQKFIAVAEMAIGRGWAHARPPRGLGKGETRRSLSSKAARSSASFRLPWWQPRDPPLLSSFDQLM